MLYRNKIPIDKVDKRYKPTFHASVPSGWANDPNGLIWYNGQAHLFFQHNPYSNYWGPMHWGHLTSKDFIRWEEQPIALKPDKRYDIPFGCFSGTAIEKDSMLYLMYTGVTLSRQQQCLAYSNDGIHFKKSKRNPVINTSELPFGASKRDFRDPKVFSRDGKFYCLVGTKRNEHGDILLYQSDDLEHWNYVGNLMEIDDRPDHQPINGVFECPDYQLIDGQEILFTSPQDLQSDGNRFQNSQSSVWIAGELDFETGNYYYDQFHELDSGFDFYAPQTMRLPDGRIILIGWKECWGREYPTEKDNWVGSFTLPRELTYREGHLFQNPIHEMVRYRCNHVVVQNLDILQNEALAIDGVSGNRLELNLLIELGDAEQVGLKVLKGTFNETRLYYERKSNCFVFDRSASGVPIKGKESNTTVRKCDITAKNVFSLRVFLDVSCVEVFLQDGYSVMTGNIYADPENDVGIEFYCKGGNARIRNLEIYDIVVE